MALLALVACESGTPIGASCARSAECASPLVCRLGRCREECRLNRDCPVATRCLIDADGLGSCSLPSDVCGAGTCNGGLLCVEGVCVSGCDPTASTCPADARCVPIAGTSSGVCDDSRSGGGDAGPRDGGTVGCSGSMCGHASAIAIAGMGDGYEDLACVVRNDGEVWCWGTDPHGDGVVNATCSSGEHCNPTPAHVRADGPPSGTPGDLPSIASLAAGQQAICAITTTGGGVRCWGENGNFELPIAPGTNYLAGRGVDAHGFVLASVEAIAIGHYVGYARIGTSWLGWGEGHYGSLASATDQHQGATAIALLDGAQSISAGYFFACGLWAPGEVRCWGVDEHGELAHGPIGSTGGVSAFDPMPTRVALPADAQAVSAAAGSACAIVGMDVWCWGSDVSGALGTLATSSDPCGCEVVPVRVDLPAGVRFVDLATSPVAPRVCARTAQGHVYCWGESAFGAAGGIMDVRAPELPIVDGSGAPIVAAHVAVGPYAACAIDMDGEVWCWGGNTSGELAVAPDSVAHPTAAHVVFP